MATFNQALRDGYNLQLIITQTSQNIAANTSTISGTLRIVRPSGQADYTSYQTVWSTGINGVNASGTTAGYNFSAYSVLTLRSWTQTITHNSDGTKSFAAAGAWRETDPDPQVGYTTARDAAGTVTLTTIPRKSNPTMSASAVDAGDPITILTHRASASFTHTITYKIGSLTGTIATKTSVADVPWTPPLSLLNAIPNSTSGTVTITVETFSGSTSLGSDTTSFTLRAPSEIVPSVGTITHSEAVSLVNTEVGAYVKNLTKLNLGISGEAGTYGSTISTRKIVVAGQTINADSGTTPNVINASGTVPITATVTDSRGRSKSETVNVTVLDYSEPSVLSPTVQRASGAGVPQADGTTMRINITASTKSLVNSTQRNNIYYTIYTRLRGTTDWGTAKIAKTALAYTDSGGRLNYNGFVLLAAYPITEAHEVRVDISDDFSTVSSTAMMATAAIDMHFDSNLGVGVGKYRENGRLDVAGDIYMNNAKVFNDSSSSLGTVDLDTIVTSGWYYQISYTEALISRHYPAANAGTLQVCVTNSGTFITQTYTGRADNGSVPKVWVRGKFGTSDWQPWSLVSAPVSFHAYRTSAVSIPNTTWTTLTWNATAKNFGGITYSNGIFTVPMDGMYLVNGIVRYVAQSPATGQRTSRITVAGSVNAGYEGNAFAPINSVTSGAETVRTLALMQGDTISFDVYQAQGAALNTVSGEQYTRIQIDRIGSLQ